MRRLEATLQRNKQKNYFYISFVCIYSLQRVIAQVDESAPGPDGVRYSDLKSLGEDDHQQLTNMLNDCFA